MTHPSKKSLQWHKDCLQSQRDSLARYIEALRRAELDVERCRNDILVREAQIARAERHGITEFDPERFGKPRKVKKDNMETKS